MNSVSEVGRTTSVLSVRAVRFTMQTCWHFAKVKRLGFAGLIIVLVTALIAIAAPLIAPLDPWRVNEFARLVPPDRVHWFGTDALGRDILSRIIYGSRISIYVGLVVMVASSTIGATIGITCAYFGSGLDLTVQRFVDAVVAFPSLLLALALMAAFGSSLSNILVALAIVFTPSVVRVVRSAALGVKVLPYVEAERAVGASNTRIMLRHILPNTFASLVVVSTSLIGSAILIEAYLSFIGVGLPANVISWGAMLAGDVLLDFSNAPWIGIFPALVLTLVVFGITVFGDALRDVLDPRLRGTQ